MDLRFTVIEAVDPAGKVVFSGDSYKFQKKYTGDVAMTLKEAKSLAHGSYIHSKTKKNTDGTPMRARVTSVKTWKTRPHEVMVKFKRGIREFGFITQDELDYYDIGYGS